jgi:serine/threonine protein kinase
MIGSTLGHYKILEKIGSGGMGDVYLAEDATLDRNVALKVLPPQLADDTERRARFTREAKAVAALNHPNIVTVYSVEEAGGVHFITMELVRGRTLAAVGSQCERNVPAQRDITQEYSSVLEWKRTRRLHAKSGVKVVGATGFEPAASRSRTEC